MTKWYGLENSQGLYRYVRLSPQQNKIIKAMKKSPDGISAVDAMISLDGMSSATLAKRVSELVRKGLNITRTQKRNPVTGTLYTKYALAA